MGGEWWFTFEGDKSKFDLELYRKTLKELEQKYKGKIASHDTQSEFWFKPTELDTEPSDNVFAKFEYTAFSEQRSWYLYWDPTIVEKPISDVSARSSRPHFTKISVELQKILTNKFPDHFQLYLGDGLSGIGPACHQYFGVTPEDYTGGFDGRFDEDYGDDGKYSPAPDFAACDKDCGYCGKCNH